MLINSVSDQFAEHRGVPRHHRQLLLGPREDHHRVRATPEDRCGDGNLTHKGLDEVLGSTAEQLLYNVPTIIAVRPTGGLKLALFPQSEVVSYWDGPAGTGPGYPTGAARGRSCQ
jgi:hypothetical protein